MVRSRKALVLLSCLLAMVMVMEAQTSDVIRTGRPGQAIGTYCLGEKIFQVQTGWLFNTVDMAGVSTDINSGNLVLRQGITERFEVSGVLSMSHINTVFNFEENVRSGISDAQIGARYHLLDNEGIIPTVGLQARYLIPLGTDVSSGENGGYTVILATGNQLSDRLSLTTNWILSSGRNKGDPAGRYILNLSYSLNEKWGTFAEVYGGLDPFENSYDGGFSYLVNNNLQLDLSSGIQHTEFKDDWYTDIGISWRMVGAKK